MLIINRLQISLSDGIRAQGHGISCKMQEIDILSARSPSQRLLALPPTPSFPVASAALCPAVTWVVHFG